MPSFPSRRAARLALAPATALAVILTATQPMRAQEERAWTLQSEDATILLTYRAPAAAETEPKLALTLLRRFLKEADAVLENAEETRRYLTVEGREFPTPHAQEVVETSRLFSNGDGATLFSVRRDRYVNSGGAHPNTLQDAVLWDPAADAPIAWTALLRAPEALAPVVEAWSKGLLAEKIARLGDLEGRESVQAWAEHAEADLGARPALLAPSTEEGRASGLIILHSPYDVGAYFEGPYEVFVPHAAFKSALKPEYAGFFAGARVAPD